MENDSAATGGEEIGGPSVLLVSVDLSRSLSDAARRSELFLTISVYKCCEQWRIQGEGKGGKMSEIFQLEGGEGVGDGSCHPL